MITPVNRGVLGLFPDLVFRTPAANGSDFATSFGRVGMGLQACLGIVSEAFLAIVFPLLGFYFATFLQLGPVNTVAVMGYQPALAVKVPFLVVGLGITLSNDQATACDIQAQATGGLKGTSALGVCDNFMALLLHGFHGVFVEIDRLY